MKYIKMEALRKAYCSYSYGHPFWPACGRQRKDTKIYGIAAPPPPPPPKSTRGNLQFAVTPAEQMGIMYEAPPMGDTPKPVEFEHSGDYDQIVNRGLLAIFLFFLLLFGTACCIHRGRPRRGKSRDSRSNNSSPQPKKIGLHAPLLTTPLLAPVNVNKVPTINATPDNDPESPAFGDYGTINNTVHVTFEPTPPEREVRNVTEYAYASSDIDPETVAIVYPPAIEPTGEYIGINTSISEPTTPEVQHYTEDANENASAEVIAIVNDTPDTQPTEEYTEINTSSTIESEQVINRDIDPITELNVDSTSAETIRIVPTLDIQSSTGIDTSALRPTSSEIRPIMENVSINSAEPTSQTPKIQPMKGKSSRSTSHKSKASGSTVAPRPKSAPVAQKRELSQVYARPISNGHEPEDVPITTEDFNSRLDHHVIKHKLEKFYPIRQDSPNPTLLRFAEAGSQETKKIQEAHGHPETSNEGNYPQSTPTPAQISTMMKVAMYRLVILIDDSGSMQDDQNRIAALGSALQKLTKNIAERFGTEGVTVRCLNYPDFPLLPKKLIEALNSTPPAPGEMDNIQTQGDMYRLFRKLDFTGITDLGGRLRTQIVEPMILGPARQGTLTKPVLVCIITDGEPDSTGKKEVVGRDKKDFRKAIKECKKGLRSAGYPESSVAFHITQVGDSKDATAFLDSLATDRKIGDIVYCTSERMDEQMNLLDSANSEADPRSHFDRFGMWWIDEMHVAIDPNQPPA